MGLTEMDRLQTPVTILHEPEEAQHRVRAVQPTAYNLVVSGDLSNAAKEDIPE